MRSVPSRFGDWSLPVEVARLRDLRVEEVERVADVLRPRVAGMADVAAVRGEQVAALDRGVGERRPVARRRRVEGVDRQPDDDEDDGEEGDQPADARDERRDQHPLRRVARPSRAGRGVVLFGCPRSSAIAQSRSSGGATASATCSVSRRRRSRGVGEDRHPDVDDLDDPGDDDHRSEDPARDVVGVQLRQHVDLGDPLLPS